MDISKQIVDTQARNLVKDAPQFFEDYPDEQHKISSAFLLLGVASYLGLDIEEASRFLTDGGEDGGFDAAFIDDMGSELTIVLFQAKYTFNLSKDSGFPENALEKAVEAIRCIFDPEVNRQLNEKSAAVVDTIHSLLYAGRIPQVTFVCLNNGVHWNKKGDDIINRAFGGQPQVSFAYYNCQDMTAAASKGRRIDADLHLTGTATHEDFNYKSVILRNLRANDERQRLLAMGAKGLGYVYKPKRDSLLRADSLTIPSTVGMEAVFTVWREKPFLAKYRKSEYFSTYYEMILGKDDNQLNAAQMILAVRIFRFCDVERRKKALSPEKNMLRRYDSYLKAALLGCLLLKEMEIVLPQLTQQNYQSVSEYLESHKIQMYERIEHIVLACIMEHLSCTQEQLMKVDGRRIASAFRNEEFYGKCRQALWQ